MINLIFLLCQEQVRPNSVAHGRLAGDKSVMKLEMFLKACARIFCTFYIEIVVRHF